MVVLTGKNLGERHRELNYKVAEAIANRKDFNEIKIEEEASDIDKLYKIDVASQYKDIDYIVEVFKSGDSLYISRALKCLWIYHDSCSHVINTEYLHDNIFPFMSLKMKKKMLYAIAMNVQNPERAAYFYTYCKNNQMRNLALKFLIFTSEQLKLHVLKNENFISYNSSDINERTFLQNFIGNSFMLATTCVEMCSDWNRTNVIYNLRYLYVTSSEKYLDILEKHEIVDMRNLNVLRRFGMRTSKHIMIKYKNRVLENPLLYVHKLKKNMLTKYSSTAEAKIYLSRIIPKDVNDFWKSDFCTAYDYILNLIPINEKFDFIKQLFTETYPGKSFETTIYFYELEYYNMLSIEQRELWALRHIEEQKEILGDGNDYQWYKFVNIDKALIEIKKYVMLTPDGDKRAQIVNILVEAARNQNDLKKVFDYYYERHINENDKTIFIDKILSVHNVFEFDIECWEALNKLFHSLDIYSVGKFTNNIYRAVAVVCHILHDIDMPKALTEFVDLDVNYSYFSLLLNKLSKEKSEIVLQYLLKLFIDNLKPFEQDPYNKKLRKKLIKYVNNISNLLACFQKGDEDCPEIVKKFMEIHSPKPKEKKFVSAKDMFFYIKTDARLAIDALGHSDLDIYTRSGMINTMLSKIKVYFHNDVAQEYVNYLDRMIQRSSDDYDCRRLIEVAIFGLFRLAEESIKVALMEKYFPSEPKINHSTIDRKLLYIQEAICRYMGYSRPPVPLKNVLQYVKGDYVQYCIPMFNMYLVNLPFPLVTKFTESLLDAPLSVQKHGLRLAFECYTSEYLKTLILNTWKKTKNVSLRLIIYNLLFNKLTNPEKSVYGNKDDVLYDALKFFTSDLHQDDHQVLFDLICSHHSRLSDKLIDDYLQTAWHMVNKLPKKPINIDRQIKVINSVAHQIKLVQRDFVRKTIIDEHVHEILERRQLRPDELDKVQELSVAKWNLTALYIVQYRNTDELEENLSLISHIFGKCVEMWGERYKETFIFQKFYFDFLTYIEDKAYQVFDNNTDVNRSTPIFQHVLDLLMGALPLKEIYLIMWKLKLIIYCETSVNATNALQYVGDGKLKPSSREESLSDNIGNHIGNFVQELVARNQFYSVYLPQIAWLLRIQLNRFHNMMNLHILVSQSLANFELKETHLLAIMILPTDVPEEMKETHTTILKKIQAFENEEIQSFLHFKLLSTYKSMFRGGD